MCEPLHPPTPSIQLFLSVLPKFQSFTLQGYIVHHVTWARNFVRTVSMQNQVKMFHDVSPTFSMDITLKLPYFPGKTIFLEPRGVSKHLRRVQRSDKSLAQAQICPFPKENTSLSEPKANSEDRRQRMNGFDLLSFLWVRLRLTQRCPVSVRPPPKKKERTTYLWVSRRRTQRKDRKQLCLNLKQILLSSEMHITIHQTLEVGSNL